MFQVDANPGEALPKFLKRWNHIMHGAVEPDPYFSFQLRREGNVRARNGSIRALVLAIGAMAAAWFAMPMQAASNYEHENGYSSFGGVDIGDAQGVVVDGDGKIYISDYGNGRIAILNQDGTKDDARRQFHS